MRELKKTHSANQIDEEQKNGKTTKQSLESTSPKQIEKEILRTSLLFFDF